MIVPGDIEDGHVDLTPEKDALPATHGTLNWIINGIQSGRLRRSVKRLIGIERTDGKVVDEPRQRDESAPAS